MEGSVSGFLRTLVMNSHNYSYWNINMEDPLIVKDLYEPIDRREIPERVLESEWKPLNKKVMAIIR